MPRHSKGNREIVKEAGTNLFAEFGIRGAAEKNAKVQLAVAINQVLSCRGLSQQRSSQLMECTQPEVSSLKNYKLALFSLERLLGFLLKLDRDIEIMVRKKSNPKTAARTTVRIVGAA